MKEVKRKIVQKAKWIGNDLLHAAGIQKMKQSKAGSRILVYHGIDEVGNTKINSRFISKRYFEKQIAYFRNHFNVISLEDYFLGKFKKDTFNIAITFDDGYANNLTYALPILEKYQVPAAFFITGILDYGSDILWPDLVDLCQLEFTGPLVINGLRFSKNRKGILVSDKGISLKQYCKDQDLKFIEEVVRLLEAQQAFKKNKSLEVYWKQLSHEEIKKLSQSNLVTIGSHGYTHSSLGKILLEDACSEVSLSKKYLENLLQREINSIAFPDGSYSPELVECCIQQGFTYQLVSKHLYDGDEQNPYLRNRLTINPHISWFNQLNSIATGSY